MGTPKPVKRTSRRLPRKKALSGKRKSPLKAAAPTKELVAEVVQVFAAPPETMSPKPWRPIVPEAPAQPSARTTASVPTRSALDPAAQASDIPSYLLEGDEPTFPPEVRPQTESIPASEPGSKAAELAVGGAEHPTHYTEAVHLMARDPHWLYAHWDLPPDRQRELNSASVDRHLVLRVALCDDPVHPVTEVHLHPESQYWFVHVLRADAKYVAELGYYRHDRLWKQVGTSGAAETPPDAVAEDGSVRVAEVPPAIFAESGKHIGAAAPVLLQEPSDESQFIERFGLGLEPVQTPTGSAAVGAPSQSSPGPEKPLGAAGSGQQTIRIPVGNVSAGAFAELSEEEEQALFRLVLTQTVRRQGPNSAEMVEEIPRPEKEFAAPAGVPGKGVSSPTVGVVGGKTSPGKWHEVSRAGFWFNINAELIVYGATEPDAHVQICGRRILLRPDGTFSYRFALPDGQYQLPATAISGDERERREARLEFSRNTEYRGVVAAHPQDPELKRPSAENVA